MVSELTQVQTLMMYSVVIGVLGNTIENDFARLRAEWRRSLKSKNDCLKACAAEENCTVAFHNKYGRCWINGGSRSSNGYIYLKKGSAEKEGTAFNLYFKKRSDKFASREFQSQSFIHQSLRIAL